MKSVLLMLLLKIVLSIAIAGVVWVLYWLLSLGGIFETPGGQHLYGFSIIVFAIQVIYDTYL